MNFNESIVLENEMVLLRPLELSDVVYLKDFAVNEPDIWKYSLMQIQNADDMEAYIASAIHGREQMKEYPFIVYDKVKKAYAGCTRYYDIQVNFKTILLGYTWYGGAFQGTHVNRHCKWLLLQYAFETLGMERVEFRADTRNARSIQAMKRIGCVEEGVLRSHLPTIEGGRRDSIILSILKEEWMDQGRLKLESML